MREATQGRVRKCHDFFSCAPPTLSPPPVFWVLPLPLGKGLNGFASKDCIYSVLLGEERKHIPGRQDAGLKRDRDCKNAKPRAGCAHPSASHFSPRPAELRTLRDRQRGRCEELSQPRLSTRVLGDGAEDRMCFIVVNNDPEYCLGLPYLGAIGAARCRQPSRKRQRFI